MAKTCLNKLGINILTTCALPVHGIKEIYLMHVEDVTVSRSSDPSWATVTFASGAKSYKVEGYKQNIQVTAAIRSLDASNKMDISVMFKTFPDAEGSVLESNFLRVLSMGKFYVLVINNDMSSFVVGDTSPLELSALDWDSNANGRARTITLSAPEGSSGNYFMAVNTAAKTEIISKAS